MSNIPSLHPATTAEREPSRALRVFNIFDTMAKRLGQPTPMVNQMAALSALAECKAIWMCLKEKGLVTDAQIQAYLDRGVDALAEQTDQRLGRVMVDVRD